MEDEDDEEEEEKVEEDAELEENGPVIGCFKKLKFKVESKEGTTLMLILSG